MPSCFFKKPGFGCSREMQYNRAAQVKLEEWGLRGSRGGGDASVIPSYDCTKHRETDG